MNKAPLMIDYYNIGHIECKSVRWEMDSIYPMLLLELSIAIRPYGEKNLPITLFDINGEVILEDGKIIGRANPIMGPLLFPSGVKELMEYSASLRIDLDPDRAALMENYRKQGKSKLKINLNVVAYIKGEFGKGATTIIVEIPEGKWRKLQTCPESFLREEEQVADADLLEPYSLKKRIGKVASIAEKKLIVEVLKRTNWNRRKAAELLGISYRSLLYKMKEYRTDDVAARDTTSSALLITEIPSITAEVTSDKIVTKRIILVDDDEVLRQLMVDTISSFGTYEIVTASDGQETLQLIHQVGGNVDLVITDCNHPKIDGIRMSKIIKDEYPEIPIVMITGYYSRIKDAVPKGLFYTIHPKPFRTETLREIIKGAILNKDLGVGEKKRRG